MTRLLLRQPPPRAVWQLEQAGIPPLLATLFASRGVTRADELDDGLQHLLPPKALKGCEDAARLLADTLDGGHRVCVVADYDCDGATACAVALRGLGLLGAAAQTLSYVVPDRAVHGYGLTPAIVDLALAQRPHLLLTVDNGIASVEGVAYARAQGLNVLVTDHHLPAVVDGVASLPDAHVIVNPNQPGCPFPSKNLAGVGVMFYVLLALRAELRQRGRFDAASQPRLDSLLDLVALGTVADVVKLDANNRRLVAQGLKRIRSGRFHAGLQALFVAAGREPRSASTFDFGFALGPRINAAGRLSDMTLGIECLLTDQAQRADELARLLDQINRERREVEGQMREAAEAQLQRWWHTQAESAAPEAPPPAVALYNPEFHEGVVGILASRIKDRMHRPTFVFALGQDGVLKGSGRSIPGFHLRDALDWVSKRHPDLLLRFGGHAMAAGATLHGPGQFQAFQQALSEVAAAWLAPEQLSRTLACDGPLPPQLHTLETVKTLEAQVWGQAFEPPLFCDEVEVLQQRLVGEKHLKLSLKLGGQTREAIWFGRTEPVPASGVLAYRLNVNEYNGRTHIQMVIEALGSES
jgi:single-stranded-DNA-specific exonuclease